MEITATATTAGSGPGIYINDSNVHSDTNINRHSSGFQQMGGSSTQQQMAKLRRESIAHSQGIGGVSWGSLTVSSWLRDEVMIHAQSYTRDHHLSVNNPGHVKSFSANHGLAASSSNNGKSPLDLTKFASPPGSSGAYLPNLEKQYCKDYSCCGQLLPSLHDLLRHYEEAHIATSPGNHPMNPNMIGVNMNFSSQNVSTGALSQSQSHSQLQSHSNTAVTSIHHGAQNQSRNNSSDHPMQQEQLSSNNISYQQRKLLIAQQRLQQQQQQQQQLTQHLQQQQQQNVRKNPSQMQSSNNINIQTQRKVPQRSQLTNVTVNGSITSATQQGQQSTTSNQQLHLNGSFVDAVSTNEVFLQSKHSQQSIQRNVSNFNSYSTKPHHTMSQAVGKRSVPIGAGLELDYMETDVLAGMHDHTVGGGIEYHPLGSMGSMSHTVPLTNTNQAGLSKKLKRSINPHIKGKGLQGRNSDSGLIDEHNSAVLDDDGDGVDDDDDDEDEDEDDEDEDGVNFNRKQHGYIDDPARRLYVMDHEEHKPFKCPVIGCDKTYKNQNGLKYHKLHGHQNQKLHENSDGTFSIIDPESNEPYPDGMGMENDKPYRCEVCGKRYKNLNGLKYHRGHSTH